jgi:hypothetical protein
LRLENREEEEEREKENEKRSRKRKRREKRKTKKEDREDSKQWFWKAWTTSVSADIAEGILDHLWRACQIEGLRFRKEEEER